MKKTILRFIIGLLLTAFITSCNKGNKVASSFGKRKYTKGYYFASARKNKLAIPVYTDEKTNTTISNTASSSGIQASGISVNDKKTSVASQSITAPTVKHKKIFQTLPEAIGISSPVKKILDNIFTEPSGVPGHGNTADDAKSSKYDHFATLAFIFLLLGIIVPIILIVGLFFLGLLLGSLLAITAIILGLIGLKSKKNHKKAIVAIILSAILLLVEVSLLYLFISILNS